VSFRRPSLSAQAGAGPAISTKTSRTAASGFSPFQPANDHHQRAPNCIPAKIQKLVGPQHILRSVPRLSVCFEVLRTPNMPSPTTIVLAPNARVILTALCHTNYGCENWLSAPRKQSKTGGGIFAPRVGFRKPVYKLRTGRFRRRRDSRASTAKTAFRFLQYLVNRRWEFDAETITRACSASAITVSFTRKACPSLGVTRLFPVKGNLLLGLAGRGLPISSCRSFPVHRECK